ncbi:hypothetical protein QQ045_011716 [Rhodiola kirilowii]
MGKTTSFGLDESESYVVWRTREANIRTGEKPTLLQMSARLFAYGRSVVVWKPTECTPKATDCLLHTSRFSVKAFLSATLGRFFLSGGLYWKVKYISHLQYLWEHIKKGDIEIPEFVQKHDDILEQRPLTDYGIEPDPHMLVELNSPVNLFWKG